MNLLGILKALVGAIAAAFLAFSGSPTPQQAQTVAEVASTTDAVVSETVARTSVATPEDVQQAYELGKSVGQLKAQAEHITQQQTPPMQENTNPALTSATVTPTSAPVGTPTAPAPATPVSQARIEIISPIPGKGLGREYVASSSVADESNYIELGAVLYDADGQAVSTEEVRVSVQSPAGGANDALVAKRMVGTGNVVPIYVNGDRRQVPVYSYHYEFSMAGQHTITFTSAGGLTASVILSAK